MGNPSAELAVAPRAVERGWIVPVGLAEFGLGPGSLEFEPEDRQRVTEFSPGPSRPSPYGLVWNIPTDGQWVIGQVKVENAPARFAVEQSTQILYLVLGALLGALAVRVGRRDVGATEESTTQRACLCYARGTRQRITA
jgi:hypothetical protein